MNSEGLNTPCFYGLPKVHKPDIPLRTIVSLLGTPTYKLAPDLQQRQKHLVDGLPHFNHSTQELLNNLRNIKFNNDEIIVSFDNTVLFTSMDIPLAKDTMATLPETGTLTDNCISKDNILRLLGLCLTAHFILNGQVYNLIFNGQVYKQINGTPMASPISGLIAQAAMQRLECTTLPGIQPKLWIRYVDDTFVIIKHT
eukprot:g32596.t1